MKIGRKILASTFIYLFGIASVFAAGPVSHFQITLYPETAQVGEPLDLIIEARDVDNNIITDYDGEVLIFSNTDPEVGLPLITDNVYKFKISDLGKVKFENGVKFTIPGTQDICVYDFVDETIYGCGDVNITETTSVSTKNIEIITPETGLTIGENKISVGGSTDQNHQVKIVVNGTNEFTTTSNDSGVFKTEITNLIDGQNLIVAKVLDANGNEVGTSKQVSIMVDTGIISLRSVRPTPGEVESETAYELEILATPNLSEVTAIINDIITKIPEVENGKYVAKLYAPKEEGTYKIDVNLKDELGHERKELGAGSLVVKLPVLPVACQEGEILENGKCIPKPPVVDPPKPEVCTSATQTELKVSGLKLVELKSKSVLTWNKVKNAESYNVYKKLENGNLEFIENVVEPKFEVLVNMDEKDIKYDYFAVKAVSKNCEGEDYEGPLSEATKIQTGPEMIMLLILAMLAGGVVLGVSNRRKRV